MRNVPDTFNDSIRRVQAKTLTVSQLPAPRFFSYDSAKRYNRALASSGEESHCSPVYRTLFASETLLIAVSWESELHARDDLLATVRQATNILGWFRCFGHFPDKSDGVLHRGFKIDSM